VASGLCPSATSKSNRYSEDWYGSKGDRYSEDRWNRPYKQLAETPVEVALEIPPPDPTRTHKPVAATSGKGLSVAECSALLTALCALACFGAFYWGSWLIGLACGFSAHLFAVAWLTTRTPPRLRTPGAA